MVFENVTVDSLFAILASQQRSRKDIAVHVSLSSDLHVKQRGNVTFSDTKSSAWLLARWP
jgi:hypothetical protein